MFCKCIARRWLVVAGYHNFSSSPSPATNFSPTGVVFTRRKEPKNQIQVTIKNRIWGHYPIPKSWTLNRRKGKERRNLNILKFIQSGICFTLPHEGTIVVKTVITCIIVELAGRGRGEVSYQIKPHPFHHI